ncbi:MAG: hypothetical protein E7Z87_00305 [Cyanobacteria bacterium SIG26]|nr:hypothetical protein [Cyanobacteria bacterium SIG26]
MKINESVKFRIDGQYTKLKNKREYMSPKSEALLSPNSKTYSQYKDIQRPLKTNHQDLTFKGLSFGLYKHVGKYSKEEFLSFADKYIGKMGRELFEDITNKHADRTSKLIQVNGDEIIVNKKSIPHLALDGILYPFKILPLDMLNGLVELMGKVPGMKKWSVNILEKPFFKNIRQRSKIDSKLNSLTGLITYKEVKLNSALENFAKQHGYKNIKEIPADEVAKISDDIENSLESHVFQSKLKMFDPKSGNYDTKHERSLNRLVSGLPPAIFLANDAYNLSRMMDDDSKEAEKERKTRFKQETSRILTSGYLTLITMGAFQSFINKSKMGIVITTGLTVLVTEMYSRLANGKHITRLTPEQAREENRRNNAKESEIKPLTFKAEVNKAPQAKGKEQQKPLLSFDTIMKASATVLGTGYGLKFAKKIPAVQKAALKYFENMKANNAEKFEKLGIRDLSQANAVKEFQSKVIFKPFTDFYKRLTSQKFEVETAKFDAVVNVLKENGFDKLAQKYDEVAKAAQKTVDGKAIIDLGKKDKKTKPLVDFVIAPFKFMWNTVTLPYWMVDEKIVRALSKSKGKSNKLPSDISVLAKSFDRIARQAEKLGKGKISQKDFQDYVQVNLLKGFNVESISSVSNAELSNLAKTAAAVATIWFLMTDNYNMVMLKSNGNDKNGAETKFKERFVQEGSRLFYQTLLIDLFNSTFRNQYNSSLLGMSLITVTNTTLGEMLTRSSVGTPLKPHTRDELIALETKQNNATGFKRKYYDFMQRLTGKRSIKSYEVASKNNENQIVKKQITPSPNGAKIYFKQNDSVLEKMVRS